MRNERRNSFNVKKQTNKQTNGKFMMFRAENEETYVTTLVNPHIIAKKKKNAHTMLGNKW